MFLFLCFFMGLFFQCLILSFHEPKQNPHSLLSFSQKDLRRVVDVQQAVSTMCYCILHHSAVLCCAVHAFSTDAHTAHEPSEPLSLDLLAFLEAQQSRSALPAACWATRISLSQVCVSTGVSLIVNSFPQSLSSSINSPCRRSLYCMFGNCKEPKSGRQTGLNDATIRQQARVMIKTWYAKQNLIFSGVTSFIHSYTSCRVRLLVNAHAWNMLRFLLLFKVWKYGVFGLKIDRCMVFHLPLSYFITEWVNLLRLFLP